MKGPDYLAPHLAEQQLEAIRHRDSPLPIIADPGSCKAEVITRRVAHLVRAGDVRPENTLVTTFTERAVLKLKERVQQKLPQANGRGRLGPRRAPSRGGWCCRIQLTDRRRFC